MPITVAMIEEKEFKTKMRGYDPVEVDEFLDEICDEMVAMQEEIATLNQRLSQASRAGAYPQVPAPAQIPAQIPAPIAPAPVKAAEKEAADEDKESEISEAAQKLLAQFGSMEGVYDNLDKLKGKQLETIRDNGKAIELNTAGWFKECKEQYPSLRLLKVACEMKIPVVISADAHYAEHVTRNFENALQTLREAGYPL